MSSPTRTPFAMPMSRTGVLVEHLGGEIRGGQFKPGDRLPTEQDLMARFGVSRTVVREAIASLRAEGLVVTRQGAGAFVAENPGGSPFRIAPQDLSSLTEVLDVLQLRLAVEVEAAALAAENRSRRDLIELEASLARLDAAVAAGDMAVEADYEFHRAIAAATGNPYFERFAQFLGTVLIPRHTVRVGIDEPDVRGRYLANVQAEHHAIFNAIRDADTEAARTAMRSHLEAGRDRYRSLADAKR